MRRFQDFIGRNFYMIETRNLAATREKGKKPAISGLDLQVGKGESCALLGANGAGKSTLLVGARRACANFIRKRESRGD